MKKKPFPTKKYTNPTNPRPHSQKEDQKHLFKKEGGGSHNPPMNLKPNDKRNRKTTPSASDSSQKPKQIQEKTPTTHNHIEGGGGVMHQRAKTPPHSERNPKTPPIRPRSYQKEHKCMPKNTPQTRETRNSEPQRPPTHPPHTGI